MKPSRSERVLNREQAKTSFYDRFGSKQDLQRVEIAAGGRASTVTAG